MDEIDGVLTSLVEKNKIPSVHYILFDRDRVIQEYVSGFADIKKELPADKKTTYHWYSVTKTFTALAILRLYEGNKLSLEQPAADLLPDFPYSHRITIRQLLSHSAGIPNPIPLNWIHLAEEHPGFDRNGFFRQVYARHLKAKSRPNERFAYSNLGYVLLGQIIERISGLSYEDYIRENILLPLGLGSGELDFLIRDPGRHAKGYHNIISFSYPLLGFFMDKPKFMDPPEGKWRPFKPFYVNGPSYGGLVGTAESMMKYLQTLLKSDNLLLSEDGKSLLFTENRTNHGKPTGMCLSWFKGRLNGYTFYTHAGGGGGYYCEIRLYPGPDMGSLIMFNRTGMRDERFLDKVDKFVLPLNP